MNLCPHAHDKDVMGLTASGRCKECHRASNRRRWKVRGPEYRSNRNLRRDPLAEAARMMNACGGTVPALRLRKLTNKEDAMYQWAAHRGVSKSAGRKAMLRLWGQSRIDIYEADRWCIVLGTHLSIVYPECYHPAAEIDA